MERRKNILMDVQLKEKPEQIVEEEPPEPKPTEEQIFKAPRQKEALPIETVEEEEAVPLIEAPKKVKRACSDKMKSHLKKCRELANAKKAQIKAEKLAKNKPIDIPPTIPEEPSHAPQRYISPQAEIDYDRIISGVSNKLEQSNLEDNYYQEMEQRIRKEEEEKAKSKYGNYFLEATQKFKRNAYKGYGSNIITGKVRGNSILNKSRQFNQQSDNPFDNCF